VSGADLGTGTPVDYSQDSFLASFQRNDYTNYAPPTLPGLPPRTFIGPCSVLVTTFQLGTPGTPPVITPLDAGPVLNITGPNGTRQVLQQVSLSPGKGSTLYGAPLGGGIPLALPPKPSPTPGQSGPRPLWLDPGTYIVDNGGGGTDIRPFTATLTLPDAF